MRLYNDAAFRIVRLVEALDACRSLAKDARRLEDWMDSERAYTWNCRANAIEVAIESMEAWLEEEREAEP